MNKNRENLPDIDMKYFQMEENPKAMAVNALSSSTATLPMTESELTIERQKVLSWFFLERFLEMLIVIPATLVAISWTSLRHWMEDVHHCWIINMLIFGSILNLRIILCFPSLARVPGCILYKIAYLFILILFHVVMAIQLPAIFTFVKWSPHFALLAAGTAGATYILLFVFSITKIVNTHNANSYCNALIMPIWVLIISQVVYYFAFSDNSYGRYMLNVYSGLFIAVLLSIKHVYYAKRCANSFRVKEIVERGGEVSFTECVSLATLAFYPSFLKEEKEKKQRSKILQEGQV